MTKKRQEQFKEQQASLQEQFNAVGTSFSNQTDALSLAISKVVEAINNQLGLIHQDLVALKSTGDSNGEILNKIYSALYQPATITDGDVKKKTMQREKAQRLLQSSDLQNQALTIEKKEERKKEEERVKR